MTVPIENQKNIKTIVRKGATRLLGVNSLGQAAYRDFTEFLTPSARRPTR